jgi:hypothetical protein
MKPTRMTLLVALTVVLAGVCPAWCRGEPAAQAVARIQRATHQPLPKVQATRASRRDLAIANGGKTPLRLYLRGPASKTVSVPAGSTVRISLPPGRYQVAAETESAGVRALRWYGWHRVKSKAGQLLRFSQTGRRRVAQARPVGPRQPARTARPGDEKGVAAAIARIRRAPHTALPPAEMQMTTGPVGKGMTLVNSTPFSLRFYFHGPVSKMAAVPAHKSREVALTVGAYEVAVEAEPKPGYEIRPFYGRHTYQSDAHYWLKVFAKTVAQWPGADG